MNGLINIYKEAGMTSFDVVAKVRKLFNVSKCGHLGTLDPMAEGVLPILIGYATRFAEYLSTTDKEYVAEFKLGEKSLSYDNSIETEKVSDKVIKKKDIEKAISYFKGVVQLKVPAYSAKKINGIRAYKLARQGEIEDAGNKEMEIYSTTLLSYDYPYGIIRISCGKGTYIRSIINQIGEDLEVGAVMTGLIRTSNGIFKSNQALKLSDLEKMKEENNLEKAIIPVYDILDWKRAIIKDTAIKSLQNGVYPLKKDYLSLPEDNKGANFFIMDKKGTLLAVGKKHKNKDNPLKLQMVIK